MPSFVCQAYESALGQLKDVLADESTLAIVGSIASSNTLRRTPDQKREFWLDSCQMVLLGSNYSLQSASACFWLLVEPCWPSLDSLHAFLEAFPCRVLKAKGAHLPRRRL